ncbi:hypothetical protein AB0O34_02835 [Sphaerisporangium sp. NPDC088356]
MQVVAGEIGPARRPVRASASNTCVKWGGKAGSSAYDSPFEHCG